MASHIWNCSNDFEYCDLTDCAIVNDTVELDNAVSGSVLSDIRYGTDKHWKYDAIRYAAVVPAGTTLSLSYRTGLTSEYDAETWSEWIAYSDPVKRIEFTLSLTDTRIVADYDIKQLLNIYTESDYRYELRCMGLTDLAIVDYAKVDYDPATITEYAATATRLGNIVTLFTPLPSNNVNVMLEYIPKDVISDSTDPYIQWKVEMTADTPGVTPVLQSIETDYTMKFAQQIQDVMPTFFRRLG